jgi:hypothetical protein
LVQSVRRPSQKTAIHGHDPRRDAEEKARESVSFRPNGSHILIYAIGYLAKIIHRFYVLQSTWFNDFGCGFSFFKAKPLGQFN